MSLSYSNVLLESIESQVPLSSQLPSTLSDPNDILKQLRQVRYVPQNATTYGPNTNSIIVWNVQTGNEDALLNCAYIALQFQPSVQASASVTGVAGVAIAPDELNWVFRVVMRIGGQVIDELINFGELLSSQFKFCSEGWHRNFATKALGNFVYADNCYNAFNSTVNVAVAGTAQLQPNMANNIGSFAKNWVDSSGGGANNDNPIYGYPTGRVYGADQRLAKQYNCGAVANTTAATYTPQFTQTPQTYGVGTAGTVDMVIPLSYLVSIARTHLVVPTSLMGVMTLEIYLNPAQTACVAVQFDANDNTAPLQSALTPNYTINNVSLWIPQITFSDAYRKLLIESLSDPEQEGFVLGLETFNIQKRPITKGSSPAGALNAGSQNSYTFNYSTNFLKSLTTSISDSAVLSNISKYKSCKPNYTTQLYRIQIGGSYWPAGSYLETPSQCYAYSLMNLDMLANTMVDTVMDHQNWLDNNVVGSAVVYNNFCKSLGETFDMDAVSTSALSGGAITVMMAVDSTLPTTCSLLAGIGFMRVLSIRGGQLKVEG